MAAILHRLAAGLNATPRARVCPAASPARRYAGIAPNYDPDAALYEPAAGVP